MSVVVMPYLLFVLILSIRRYDTVIDCTLQCTPGFECDIATGLQHGIDEVSSAFAPHWVNLPLHVTLILTQNLILTLT